MRSRRARTLLRALPVTATAAFGLVALWATLDQFLSYRYYTTLAYVHFPERIIRKEAGWVVVRGLRGQIQVQIVRPLFEVRPPSPVPPNKGLAPPWGLGLRNGWGRGPGQSSERWRFARQTSRHQRPLEDGPTATPLFQRFGFLVAQETFKEPHAFRHAGPDEWFEDLIITGPEAEALKHRWWLFDLIVPHWFIALVAGVLAWLCSRPLRAAWRGRRRSRRGLCPACGYDLRGSGTEAPCPECGAVSTPAPTKGPLPG